MQTKDKFKIVSNYFCPPSQRVAAANEVGTDAASTNRAQRGAWGPIEVDGGAKTLESKITQAIDERDLARLVRTDANKTAADVERNIKETVNKFEDHCGRTAAETQTRLKTAIEYREQQLNNLQSLTKTAEDVLNCGQAVIDLLEEALNLEDTEEENRAAITQKLVEVRKQFETDTRYLGRTIDMQTKNLSKLRGLIELEAQL